MTASKRVAATVVAAWLALPGSAAALTFTVDTSADLVDSNPGDGVCDTGQGSCSLRAAIQEANAWTRDPVDRIELPAGTYLLSRTGTDNASAVGDLDILSPIEIVGAGAGQTIIDGNRTDRVFDVGSTYGERGAVLTLDGVTVQNGLLNDTPFTNPGVSLDSIDGGGIRVQQGGVVVRNSVVRANAVQGSGGGIYALFGNVTLENSQLLDNEAAGFGAGVFIQDGNLRITDSTVADNYQRPFPQTIAGGGLAIFNAKVQIERSLFARNRAFRDGAGIYFAVGDMNIINTTFSDNVALRNGGGLYVSGGNSSVIYQPVRLSNVTFAFNQAKGVDNEVPPTDYTPRGGGLFVNRQGAVTAVNTLFSGHTLGGDCWIDSEGSLVSKGHNLDTDGSCGFSATGDLSAASGDHVAQLADNGGPTFTNALLATSPAVDAGDDAVCAANGHVDQRGYVRPSGGCDIGAFEIEGDSGIAPPPPPPEEPADNLPPVAQNMVIVVRQGSAYSGMLSAQDPNGDPLTYEIVSQVGHDNVSGLGQGYLIGDEGAPEGAFGYIVDPNQSVASDMFTYRACDPWNRCSNTAQVQVLIDQGPAAGNVALQVVSSSSGVVPSDSVAVLSPQALEAVTSSIDYTYPVGGLALSVNVEVDPNASANTATVVLQFPNSAEIRSDAVVRKLDNLGQWRTLPSSQPVDPVTGQPIDATWAELDVVARTVTLHLVDGDEFDRNPAPGVIADPVAIAVPAGAPVADSGGSDSGTGAAASSSDVDTSLSGGGAGGWLVLLAGAALLRRRR